MRTAQRLFGLTLALLLLGSTSAWAQLPANELEGTWKMESRKIVYPDSVVDRSDNWGANFKILNSTHFAWGRETKDGETVLAGGGRYEYYPERDLYIEHVQYHSDPSMNGVTIRFQARVEGDTWYHVGELVDFKIREVWKQVDPHEVRTQLRQDTMSTAEEAPGASGQ